MNFRVGQKVVCVDDSVVVGFPKGGMLMRGHVYTVRQIGTTVRGEVGVHLNEVRLTSEPGCVGIVSGKPYIDAFYRAARFRPAVERKTDISIFTAILNRRPETVR